MLCSVPKRLHRVFIAVTVSLALVYLYHFPSVYRKFRFFDATPDGQTVLGDLTDLVNVFIGTTGPGHVFPGPTLPHGMVKVGMDTDSRNNHAGYDADPQYLVTGFSQLHEDGTGGSTPLSNFKLFPMPSCPIHEVIDKYHPANVPERLAKCATSIHERKVARRIRVDDTIADADAGDRTSESSKVHRAVADDIGQPGYFATNLSSGVRVELTAASRTALHRYTFPARPEETDDEVDDWRPRIIVDMINDGSSTGSRSYGFIDRDTGRVTGGARFSGSFGAGKYDAFVCVDFRSLHALDEPLLPAEFATYSQSRISPDEEDFVGGYGEQGVLLTFSPSPKLAPRMPRFSPRAPPKAEDVEDAGQTVILARVGVSLISHARACRNAEHDIPDFDFERVRESARKEWTGLLGRIEVDATENQREDAVLFYSSLYRSHIVPADWPLDSGENPNWESAEPYYDSLYCNWDTYRTLFPLMSLHDPTTFARIVRSFIDVQQHEGWLPECRSATLQQFVQGGSNADPILSEFFVKYKMHAEALNVSSEALYNALLADAEVEPDSWQYMGRQANTWKQYGYIPSGLKEFGGIFTRQGSRTLEYAFNDFTISQVSRELGRTADWQKYQNRSRGWENLWNPDTVLRDVLDEHEVEGIRGFIQPKYATNNSFGWTDPRHCTVHDPTKSMCFLDAENQDGFYEGGSIVYSQYIPHDTARLIKLQGGEEAFIRRLDYIFDNGYFDATNEPSQQIPFMYHYANRPGLSTERSRQAIASAFGTSVDGLPGNDDSGAMASFVVFHMLGLYPLPGTREFLISSPFFRAVQIRNPLFGTTTTIRTHESEGNPRNGAGGNIYVKSIRINGDLWHSRCYIDWSVFELGATVDIELGDDRTLACGEDEKALPPSLSTSGYGVL